MSDIDRRTLLKAAAWSVPVLAIATTVPLASASTETITINSVSVNGASLAASVTLSGSTGMPDDAFVTINQNGVPYRGDVDAVSDTGNRTWTILMTFPVTVASGDILTVRVTGFNYAEFVIP